PPQVAHSDGHDFLRRGNAGQHLAAPVFAKRAHAKFTRSLPQRQSRAAFVDHVAHIVVDHENLEDADSTPVTNLTASLAPYCLHYLSLGELAGLDLQRAQFGLAEFPWLFAVCT